jgi:hypothetical protein
MNLLLFSRHLPPVCAVNGGVHHLRANYRAQLALPRGFFGVESRWRPALLVYLSFEALTGDNGIYAGLSTSSAREFKRLSNFVPPELVKRVRDDLCSWPSAASRKLTNWYRPRLRREFRPDVVKMN